MVPLRKLAAFLILGMLVFPCLLGRAQARSTAAQNSVPHAKSLFAQSAVQILEHEFNESGISYLLFDARTEALLSSRWEDAARPIPLGSLVKPFTALA
jgi:hypothetical protein